MSSTPYLDIVEERNRQKSLWGRQEHSLPRWLAILMEEVGEAANAALHDEEFGPDPFYEEIVHVAAVCVAILEDSCESVEGSSPTVR
jgi:NTP pyrophosphatase (non-canonical NTP hydrolase)